jgi:tRNA A-37 threonylcarbamoyl transferase component Bud32
MKLTSGKGKTGSLYPYVCSEAVSPDFIRLDSQEELDSDRDQSEPAQQGAVPYPRNVIDRPSTPKVKIEPNLPFSIAVPLRNQLPKRNKRIVLKALPARVSDSEASSEQSSETDEMPIFVRRSSQVSLRTPEGIQGVVKRWRVLGKIGQGSHGEVFKAEDVETQEVFTVKRTSVRPDSARQQSIARLESEEKIMRSLDHPNIVRLIGSERMQDSHCLYLEYFPGQALSQVLAKSGSFTEQKVRHYLKQLTEALAYLHSHQIVHRDLKSANILVHGRLLKLCDFGCSRMYESLAESQKLDSVQGTVQWMAPEVITQTGYGRKADIWSLGCVALEMLTGKEPWPKFKTHIAAIVKIGLSQDIPEIPDTVSTAAQDFVKLCLARDPKARPRAGQLLRHVYLS